MAAKVSDKSRTARWVQAVVITFVLYLMMGISESESTSNVLSDWRSADQWNSAHQVIELPPLPLLLR